MMSHEHTQGAAGRPLRIGMLTDCFLPNIGGAELVVHNLARTFTALGHDVVVMAPRSREPFADDALPYAVSRYRPLPDRMGLKTLAEAAALLRCRRRHGFDVVNVHKTYAAYSAAKVRGLLRVPVAVTAHGGDIQKDTRIGYGRRIESPRWERKIGHAVCCADALVAISSESVDRFRELGAEPARIHRIPNGVDVDRFRQVPTDTAPVPGLMAQDRVVLAVGRYHVKKGYESLVRAMPALLAREPLARVVIVGKGTDRLRPLARELAVMHRLLLVGEQAGQGAATGLRFPNDRLLALYRRAAVFVSPSIIEGFSLVCLEAMAAGLPLVLTRCPGNEDVFEQDGRGGYYVPVGAPDAIADRVAGLLADEPLRRVMGAHSAAVAAASYSLESVACRYVHLFRELTEPETARSAARPARRVSRGEQTPAWR